MAGKEGRSRFVPYYHKAHFEWSEKQAEWAWKDHPAVCES